MFALRPPEHGARRIERHLAARGRRLIGWDEILEGGLAPGATVMSWRGEAGGIAAAQAGHDVVMAPQECVYFDWRQAADNEPAACGAVTTLEKVYAYEPVPAALTPAQACRVLGGQGQLWTEYIPNGRQVEFMAFPRACALAEVLWSPAEGKDFADFLGPHGRQLPPACASSCRHRNSARGMAN